MGIQGEGRMRIIGMMDGLNIDNNMCTMRMLYVLTFEQNSIDVQYTVHAWHR